MSAQQEPQDLSRACWATRDLVGGDADRVAQMLLDAIASVELRDAPTGGRAWMTTSVSRSQWVSDAWRLRFEDRAAVWRASGRVAIRYLT